MHETYPVNRERHTGRREDAIATHLECMRYGGFQSLTGQDTRITVIPHFVPHFRDLSPCERNPPKLQTVLTMYAAQQGARAL